VDWVFSLPFLAAFGLVLVVFDPLQRVARLFGPRPHEIVAGLLQASLLFDIPILGALLFSNFPKYVSKRELARWIPSISYNLRRGGNAIIDRGDRAQAERAIRALGARAQKRRVSVVIYPEGTRARTGELGRFRHAGTLALLEAAPRLAVVPVAIDGSWRLLCHNLTPVPFGVRIRLRFGHPIPRGEADDDPVIFERARAEIEDTLRLWRSEDSEAA
jgi:1-acyl-sn-glycerol-3-phosphate acyltransferase